MNRSFPNPWPEPTATLPPAERQFRLQREEIANRFSDEVAAIMTEQTLFGPLYGPESTLSPAEKEFRLEREDRAKRFTDELAAETIIQILGKPNLVYGHGPTLSPAAKEDILEREVMTYNFIKEFAAKEIGKILGGPERNLAERDFHLQREDRFYSCFKKGLVNCIDQIFHRQRYVGTHEDPFLHDLATVIDQKLFD